MPNPTPPATRRTSWTPSEADDAAVAVVAGFLRDHCGRPFPSYTDALRYSLQVAVDVLKPSLADAQAPAS